MHPLIGKLVTGASCVRTGALSVSPRITPAFLSEEGLHRMMSEAGPFHMGWRWPGILLAPGMGPRRMGNGEGCSRITKDSGGRCRRPVWGLWNFIRQFALGVGHHQAGVASRQRFGHRRIVRTPVLVAVEILRGHSGGMDQLGIGRRGGGEVVDPEDVDLLREVPSKRIELAGRDRANFKFGTGKLAPAGGRE
jgi:hypothetical protein